MADYASLHYGPIAAIPAIVEYGGLSKASQPAGTAAGATPEQVATVLPGADKQTIYPERP